jgi:hypothetical protein
VTNIKNRAVFSLLAGIAVVTAVPVVSLLFAPCGFPLALVTAISAIILGRRTMNLNDLDEQSLKYARTGVVCGWVGLGVNTVIMLIKLAMFFVMFILPILAILNGAQGQDLLPKQ